MSYQRGFEDAVELCLMEIEKTENIEEIRRRIQYLLGLVKEHKFDQIKQRLGVMGARRG